jgi:uncharacterized C2H2 Zn-finger protein
MEQEGREMLRCVECGEIFEDNEVILKEVCLENYYGVGGMFGNHHYTTFKKCPHCGGMELEDYYEDEDEEEEEEE